MIEWDVFISHASEDKLAVARPLADILAASGVTIWLDEAELALGDSLLEKIDEGLSRSQFAVVILSPNFFSKRWPKSELDGLIARESTTAKVVLPVWHNVTFELVRTYSPILSGRVAVSTNQGLHEVAKKILQAIRSAGRDRATGRPVFAGRLTKKALLSFPLGSILISNTINQDLTPQFVEEIGGMQSREEQWKRLRAASIPSGKVYVFENMSDFRMHMASRHDWLCDELRSTRPA